MPEGDSIYKVAEVLRPRLVGRELKEARTRGGRLVPGLSGVRVEGVETHGKHLVVRPESGPHLRVHLGMYGKWRRYEPGVPWRRSRASASLILETEEDVFACFKGHVQVLRGGLPGRAPALVVLGPDLLAEEVDYERIMTRASALPERPIGEVLMDQRVAAGIGNVYKSEVLFLRGLPPQRPVKAISAEELRETYELAAELMRQNLGRGWRVTRGRRAGERPHRPGESRYHVYRRAGRPCFRCRTPIRMARQGTQARSSYWCPSCQPER